MQAGACVQFDESLVASHLNDSMNDEDQDFGVEGLIREARARGRHTAIDRVTLCPKVRFRALEVSSQRRERVGIANHRLAVWRVRVSQVGSVQRPTMVTGVPTFSFEKIRSR